MNRGSHPAAVPTRRGGLRFNEAPIHESGKCARQRAMQRDEDSASMRPRFMNRGSVPVRSAQTRSEEASMRPRFMNRGSSGAAASRTEALALQ